MSEISRRFLMSSLVIMASLCYYLATTLPHELFGAWINDLLLTRLDRHAYEYLWLGITLASFSLYLICLRSGLQKPRLPLLFWWMIITLISWNILFVTNIEMIHIVQYAFMALLLGFIIKDHYLILIWCTVLGALDEMYQYLYLAPETSMYYDFNDVFINILGAGFGLIYLETRRHHEHQSRLRHYTKIILLGVVVILLITYFTGAWCIQGLTCDNVLLKEPIDAFWKEVPPNLSFHQMHPVEGALSVLLILWTFYYLRFKYK